jgi:hypothetical protein
MSQPTTGDFIKTPGWMDWCTGPSKPRFQLPTDPVDAHCHEFGSGAEFPCAPKRKYTPCDASKRQLYAVPTTVVVDRMGRPDVSLPVDGPQLALFQKFMREHINVWRKVACSERLSVTGPKALNGEKDFESGAYQDVIPFAQRIVQEFPDRVQWGTDWPPPNLKDHTPATACWWTTRCAFIGLKSYPDFCRSGDPPRSAFASHLRLSKARIAVRDRSYGIP